MYLNELCKINKNLYELKHNFQYDYCIKLRSDMFWNSPLLISDNLLNNNYIFPNHNNFNGINDQFVFCSNKNMNEYCSIYENFEKYKGSNGETTIKNFIKNNNYIDQYIPIDYVIKRTF